MKEESKEHLLVDHPIIIYDGTCSFCNYWVQFVLKRDKTKKFYFIASQKEKAQSLLESFDMTSMASQTVMVYFQDKLYMYSDAVLFIMKEMNYSIRYIAYVIPRFIRDAVYKGIAKYRYKIPMWNKACLIPSEEDQKRFL